MDWRRSRKTVIGCLVAAMLFVLPLIGQEGASVSGVKQDPGAWGDDHVGKALPEWTTGDVCLFCHREKVGENWASNRHGRTIKSAELVAEALRKRDPKLAKEVQYVMAGGERERWLKASDEFGKLGLWMAKTSKWDFQKFGDRCAGCHASVVDPETKAFSTISLDCVVCHGVVSESHSEKDQERGSGVYYSPIKRESARVVISVCASCHIRSGQSKSSGRPYANHFLPGDNLFRDFRSDFSDENIAKLPPGDRHVLANVRDVVVLGQEKVTCLSCHSVHQPAGRKHQRLVKSTFCANCHQPGRPMKEVQPLDPRSSVCEY